MSIARNLIALDALMIASAVSASIDMPRHLNRSRYSDEPPDHARRRKARVERKKFEKRLSKQRRKKERR